MPRFALHRRHWLLLIGLLLALGGTLPIHAQLPLATSASVTASPAAVHTTLALGSRKTVTITLNNPTKGALQPSLYKALPATPSAFTNSQRRAGPARVALPTQAARIDPQLQASFAAAADQPVDFLVLLHAQADLSAAYNISDWAARGQFVYETLTNHANQSQRELRAALSARGLHFTPFWIVNAVLVHGTSSDAAVLAARSDVALLRQNHTTTLPPDNQQIIGSETDLCSPDDPGNPICWNLRKVGADRVWREFGVTGQGIVVANIDTGVSYTHPALLQSYRGYQGASPAVHDYNWYDPQSDGVGPFDENGHGTHTIGTMVASAASDRPAVGVAPGARWVAAQGCENVFCTESDLIGAAQWVLAPTRQNGSSPRPDLRPMIVNNSWGGTGGSDWYAGYTAAWRAAGIFPLFAAGNSSGGADANCGSIASPGDYADVVAIGASDGTDGIARFSQRGPSKDGRIKPDFVAPGTYISFQQGVYSTYIGTPATYRALQGTSMAAPNAAGIVALLWSANPALIGDYQQTYEILRQSAQRLPNSTCGEPVDGKNNVFGAGRLDAYAAVARARVSVPWLEAPTSLPAIKPGTSATAQLTLDAGRVPGPGNYRARVLVYSGGLGQAPTVVDVQMTVANAPDQARIYGRITNQSGTAIQATVGLAGGLGMATNANGEYSLTVALAQTPSSYDLLASATAYQPASRRITLSSDTRLDLVLTADQPRIVVGNARLDSTLALNQSQQVNIPISNQGTQPLYYHVKVPLDRFGAWRSDEAGGPRYQWIDLPPDAPTLSFATQPYTNGVKLGIEFPFYSYTVTETTVSQHGMLAFAEPISYSGMAQGCLPDNELFFYALAPLRADLDPARGGKVRYSTVNNGQTFVLSFEQVPLRSGPASDTYTFQALLHNDGRIVYQYKHLAPLPQRLSVGVQRTGLEYLSIGCGRNTPIRAGLAIEFRPQPGTNTWLLGEEAAGVVPPGEGRTIALQFKWAHPAGNHPFRGRIIISSSDVLNSLVTRQVQMTPQAPPADRWIPLVPKSNS